MNTRTSTDLGSGQQRAHGAAAATALGRRLAGPRVRTAAVGTVSVAAAIFVWYLVTDRYGLISPLELPGPSDVWVRLRWLSSHVYLGHTLWGHTEDSIEVAMGAWVAGAVIGVPLGVAMAWSRRARALTFPVFQLLRPISPIAWIPVAIVWLGIGVQARIFIAFIAAVVPWILNSMEAVESVDRILVAAARNLGSGSFDTLRRVVLPAGLPTFLGGARVALGNAWTAVIAAELLGATSGLGFIALNASRALDTTTVLTAMIVIGALGLLFSFVMRRITPVLAPWSKAASR